MITAYADNGKINDYLITITYSLSEFTGINWTNHQCGSGGLGQAWPNSSYNTGDKYAEYSNVSG